MRSLNIGRDEAENLVDLLEADAGHCTYPRASQVAQNERDWRLQLANDLRKQWGMCSRQTEAERRRAGGRQPTDPREFKR